MKKVKFVYTRVFGHKNIIYENVTNHERLEDLIKMFSDNPLIVKISYDRYNLLQTTIYVTCEFESKEFSSHYKKIEEKDGYNDQLLKIDRIVECKLIVVVITSLLSSINNNFIKSTKIFIIGLKIRVTKLFCNKRIFTN
jgi:hypothetical protein